MFVFCNARVESTMYTTKTEIYDTDNNTTTQGDYMTVKTIKFGDII